MSTPLSVNQLEKFNFSISPIPEKDFINVSAAKNIQKVEIFNTLGQKVMTKEINNSTSQINVSDLSNGVYVLKAVIDTIEGSYKFVK